MTESCNWCTLKVDDSGLYALMCLHTVNAEEEHVISTQMVLDFLKSNGVVYGVSNIAVSSMIEHAMFEQYICVAQGIKPTKGQDGYFKYEKATEDMKKKPLIHDDGSVDYKNSLNIATIKEGELLATYIPPTAGQPGKDVFGKEIPSPGDGKKLPPLRGRGIRADEKNEKYYALYNGHIVVEDTKIYIDKLYRVDGDLNIDVGNIRFDGDVEVMGDVRSGLSIESGGNIFIHGHVGACTLIASGNIVIEKGIQGKNACIICADQDVACKYVESCKITAGNDIYADSVLDSNLIADHQIFITSKSGKVISSEVYGMCGVIVKEVGNDAGVPTLIRAGLPRETYVRAAELDTLIKQSNEKISSFNHHLESLEKLDYSSDPKLADARMQIIRARIVLTTNLNNYENELEKLQERITNDSANSFIHVTGTIFEGVRIYIGACPYIVEETIKEVSFHMGFGEVKMEPLFEQK